MAFTLNRKQLFNYTLLLLLLLLLYLAFLVIKPFATYIIFSAILTFLLYPVYRWLLKRLKRPMLASSIMIILSLVLIILPSFFIVTSLVKQSVGAYNSFTAVTPGADGLLGTLFTRFNIDASGLFQNLAQGARDYFLNAAPNIFGRLADVALGLFIMFFLMFFAFIDGNKWYSAVKESVPLAPHLKQRLFSQVKSITEAVIYGQLLTSLIQGALGGLMFAVFGIPNPVFWGFIMVIMAFIPFLGTPLIWVPAGLWQLGVQHNYVGGIGILVVGGLVVTNVDNLLRPRLIGGRAHLATPLVLLGVLGGLKVFGFMGIVLGPLILALLHTVIKFFNKEHGTA